MLLGGSSINFDAISGMVYVLDHVYQRHSKTKRWYTGDIDLGLGCEVAEAFRKEAQEIKEKCI